MKPDVMIRGKLATILTAITSTESEADRGSIVVMLCGYGSQVPRVQGEALFSLIQVVDITNRLDDPAPGTFEFLLYSNAEIYPPGTYYTFTVKDANGDIVQIEAYELDPGEFDLSKLTPFDPNQPPPPLPIPVTNQLLIVDFSETPEFPGDEFTSWQITLAGDVSATFTNLIDGNLYTIIIIQDGSGNHLFDWPDNAFNTTAVNSDPNAMTIQTFVAINNELYPIGSGTYQ